MQKFHLAHSRQWNRLVDTVMNFWVPWKLGNTWSSWVAISMSERLCSVELTCSDLVYEVSPQPSLSYRFYVYSLPFTKFKICNLSLLQHACNNDTVRYSLLWYLVLQSLNQCTSHDKCCMKSTKAKELKSIWKLKMNITHKKKIGEGWKILNGI